MKKLKSERGSVTVFVLAGCLFFLFSVVGVAQYTKNRENAIDSKYSQIKNIYEKDIDKQDEIYNQVEKNNGNEETTVKFKSQDIYILPTDGSAISILQNFDLSGKYEIKEISYGWSTAQNIEPTEYINLQTNINSYTVKKDSISSQSVYYLHVKVKNSNSDTETKFISDAINVVSKTINVVKNATTANITYPKGINLFNKKVGQGATLSEAKNNMKNNNQTSITLENSSNYVYVEATDSHGNKIYFE